MVVVYVGHALPCTAVDFVLPRRRLSSACRCVTANIFAVDFIDAGSYSVGRLSSSLLVIRDDFRLFGD